MSPVWHALYFVLFPASSGQVSAPFSKGSNSRSKGVWGWLCPRVQRRQEVKKWQNPFSVCLTQLNCCDQHLSFNTPSLMSDTRNKKNQKSYLLFLHHAVGKKVACLLISWLQSPSAVILKPKKIKSVTVSIVSPKEQAS